MEVSFRMMKLKPQVTELSRISCNSGMLNVRNDYQFASSVNLTGLEVSQIRPSGLFQIRINFKIYEFFYTF